MSENDPVGRMALATLSGQARPAAGRPRPDTVPHRQTGTGGSEQAVGLSLYRQEVRRLEPAPEEEQRRLLACVRSGDLGALDEMTRRHLALVVELADEQYPDTGNLLELLETGNEALVEAISAFAANGGRDFRPFARSRIRAALDRSAC